MDARSAQPSRPPEVLARILLFTVLLTPLIVVPARFTFPSIVPKVLYLRALAVLMLAAWACLAATDWKRYGIRRTPVNLAVGLSLLGAGLATLVSEDLHRSLWDTDDRMIGLVTLLHYGAIYVAATTVLRGWEDWRWVFRNVLAVSLLVTGGAVLQWLRPGIFGYDAGWRLFSTLGHPAYFGGFSLFAAFAAVLLLVRDRRVSAGWRAFAVAGLLAGIAGVVLSETRGTFLGLATGGAVLLVVRVLMARRPRRAVVLLLSSVVLLVAALTALRGAGLLQRVPGLKRFAGATLTSGTVHTRLLAWESSLHAAADRPVLGWGLNGFRTAFNVHYPPRMLEYGFGEAWWEDAHNPWLNALVEGGAVGLLMYLLFVALPFVALLGARRRQAIGAGAAVASAALLAAHHAHTAFLFETPASLLCLAVFLAWLNSATVPREPQPASAPGARARWLPAIFIPVALAAAWMLNVPAGLTSHRANAAAADVHLAEPAAALERLDAALATSSPHRFSARNHFAQAVIWKTDDYARAGRREEALALGIRAFRELGANLEEHPLDIRPALGRGRLAVKLSAFLHHHEGLKEAERDLERARALSPRRQEILFTLAAIRMQTGRIEGAIELLREAVEAAPSVERAWKRLVRVYRELGREAEAREAERYMRELVR